MVCIYTFVPTETRQNFNNDNLNDKQLMSYARLMNIKATWQFGDREAAMRRLEALKKRNKAKGTNSNSMAFVVNDNTVITSPSQFKSNRSRELYKQLVELRQMQASLQSALSAKRKAYHQGDKSVANDILKAEKQLEQYQQDINNTEKNIRISEVQ
jgi:DNA-binding transcriptional regulator GbsR (MarR family)